VVSLPTTTTPFGDANLTDLGGGVAKLPGGNGHDEPWPPLGDGVLLLFALALTYAGAIYRKRRKETEE
jgi:hypothetical protein